MTKICPKCNHARRADEQAPKWQCPACGVAYSKVGQDVYTPAAQRPVIYHAERERARSSGWLKWVIIAAMVYGAWVGVQAGAKRFGDPSVEDLAALAATVKAEEVVMYSTTECGYCTSARQWLVGNGFAFTECNMSVDSRCESEFRRYGADGTPFLVITRGDKVHLMRKGMNRNEFLTALRG